MSKDLKIGAAVAVLLHGLLFYGFAGRSIPEYSVIVSPSSLEVSLVAAPPRVKSIQPEVAKKQEKEISKKVSPVTPPQSKTIPVKMPQVKEVRSPSESQKKIQKEPEQLVQPKPKSPNLLQGAFTKAMPLELVNTPPRYPRVARVRGYEGVVVLRVYVNAVGSVGSLKIKKSSGFESLDKAALKAIQKWKFTPAKHLGRSVTSEIELPVRFRLEKV